MIMMMKTLAALCAVLTASLSYAHGDHDHGPAQKPPPFAILQLDQARDAAAQYLDVNEALKDGYVDIGLFVPNMGWHYLNDKLLDSNFDWTRPEILVYADDPCGGGRKLVAVEYAVPFALSKRAPHGFVGKADVWDANQQFQLWTLHAWVYEFNPDGVFAGFNPRVQ
jgi:hypothetical protein